MSDINYGEVLYSCRRKSLKHHADQVFADLEALPLKFVRPGHSHEEASQRKAVVSAPYADCFAAAIALRDHAPLVTGDQELRKVGEITPLQLHWLGP